MPTSAAIVEATRMAILASSCSTGSSNARPVTNTDTVKPMPASAPTPTMPRHVAPGGSSPTPSRTASHVNAVTPTQLADDEPDDDAVGDRRRHGVAERVERDRDTGVGEGEQRDDDEARPRVQDVLQPLDDRHRRRGRGRPSGGRGRRRRDRCSSSTSISSAAMDRTHRCQQAEHDAGDRGVDARLVDGEPQRHAEHDVDDHRPQPGRPADDDHPDDGERRRARPRRRCRRSRRRR